MTRRRYRRATAPVKVYGDPVRITAAAILLLAAAPARPASLPPFVAGGQPILLRLEGAISPDAARHGGAFTLVQIGFLRSEHAPSWLGVTDVRVIGGNDSVLGKDVLDALAPLRPNLLAAGPEALVARLRDAPPGTRVQLEGLLRWPRMYHLRAVELVGDASVR